MKKFFYLALAAAAMASCSSDESITSPEVTAEAAGDAVSFGVYTQKTRSTIENLGTVQNNGFGVFAFSQMTEPIASYSKQNYMPNFMYNQQVKYNAATPGWEYTPIKYWPNNPGALVSFYAYAPYIKEFNDDQYVFTPESNDYSNENKTVDSTNVRLILGYDSMGPAIEYTRSSDARQGVDLLWGASQGTYAPDGLTLIAPVDSLKQGVNQEIKFTFKHAMSRIYFNVQVWPDEPTTGTDVSNATNELADNTTIEIKKVELIGNVWNKGTLRLYDGPWKHDKGDYSNLVFEGEDLNPAVANITKGDAAKEIDLLRFYNPSVDASGEMKLDKDIDNFVMLMPESKFAIQITYDVITKDPLNDKNTSVVTNVIKSTDTNAVITPDAPNGITNVSDGLGTYTIKQGYAYNFHLNIGVTSVKFNAEVDDWKIGTDEISLPDNTTNP